jgi:hypothetical protein
MKQNQELIESLVKLYWDLPQDDEELMVRRVAVLVEMHMRLLEENGIEISRESLLSSIKDSGSFKKIA